MYQNKKPSLNLEIFKDNEPKTKVPDLHLENLHTRLSTFGMQRYSKNNLHDNSAEENNLDNMNVAQIMD